VLSCFREEEEGGRKKEQSGSERALAGKGAGSDAAAPPSPRPPSAGAAAAPRKKGRRRETNEPRVWTGRRPAGVLIPRDPLPAVGSQSDGWQMARRPTGRNRPMRAKQPSHRLLG